MPSSLIHLVHRKNQAALPQITVSSLLAPKPTSNLFLTLRATWNLETYYLPSWVNNTKASVTPPVLALSYPWKSLSLKWAAPSTGKRVDHVHASVAEQEELKSLCLLCGYSFLLTVGLQISAHSEMQVRRLWSHEMDQKIEKKRFQERRKKAERDWNLPSSLCPFSMNAELWQYSCSLSS